MDITLKTILLFGSVILTGLSAGFFYAWSVSVIPGTGKVPDLTYLETMQSINRAILNPAFFLVFFGSLVLLSLASIYEFHTSRLVFGLVLGAPITYLLGTFGVTAMGNVPLNNQLDVLDLAQMNAEQIGEFREYYETRWNRLHGIRTVFAVVAFLGVSLALFFK
ncbi:anthrone oxygenase family protein [Robiginitalea biformata]|uniref:Putative integral-membrane protein n=1 Tax=Robiginitalea biformata (strain ATCC BAA-864 / DSM 15991 / KCTC 12146 / HTCC2501) TaxID=313596 RepID=A4CMF0_ROBBH|nr:DUF1772 domain-containing protein [Robiginitalea biformata]EAR14842.1 putative integral-membrane protein [Robiginitalea biformata HTCC2501]